jgi:hypothetical protein
MALSMYVPKAGYKELEGGNYYIPDFGYLSIDGAAIVPGISVTVLNYGRGFARALNRGFRSWAR